MVGEMRQTASEVMSIYAELDSIRRGWLMLTDPAALPGTAADLYAWVHQARMFALQSTRGGIGTFDRLMASVISLLQRLIAMVARISAWAITGTVGGLQYLSSLLQAGLTASEQLKASVIAGQHLLLGQPLIEQVTSLAYPAVIAHEMRTWGLP